MNIDIFKFKTHIFELKRDAYHILYRYVCSICGAYFISYYNFNNEGSSRIYNIDEFIQNSGCCLSCDEYIIKNIIE